MEDRTPRCNGDVGRRTPAKGVHVVLGQPTIVWLTVCTKDRIAWLTQVPVMSALHDVWAREARAWLVGDYLLMPDHLHFRWIHMMENPVRKGLVARLEDWPWPGRVFDLHW